MNWKKGKGRINSVCLVFYVTHFSEFFFFSLWFYVPFLMAACFCALN